MGDSFRHRGITVAQHGRLWRFYWAPQRAYLTAPSLERALSELDRLIEARDRSRYAATVGGLTVSGLIDEWWKRKQRELRESSQMRYEGVIRLHIGPRIGDVPADTIRPMDVEDFYSKVTYKTALVSRDVLRPAFRWGMANRVVIRSDGVNPFDLAVLRRSRCLDGDAETDALRSMQVDERAIPKLNEVEKLLADAEEREQWTWWLYLRMAPTLGARPGEQCALQRRDLGERKCTISIDKSSSGAVKRVTAPKRPASVRILEVGEELFEDIGPLIERMQPGDVLFPATGLRYGSRTTVCWTANGVHKRLRPATERLGLPPYTPHSFRHLCATHLLDQGWPPMQVARWLGHRNDTMVRLLYAAHVVEDTRMKIGSAAARLVRRQAPRIEVP